MEYVRMDKKEACADLSDPYNLGLIADAKRIKTKFDDCFSSRVLTRGGVRDSLT